jgi:nitrogen-specific signal transduction histidine kinase
MATIYYAVVPKIPPPTGKSEILYGVENAMERGVYFISNAKEKIDIFFDHRAPSIVVGIEEYKNGFIRLRRRGDKIRAFTEITRDNVKYCKKLLELVDDLCHLDGVKGGIALNGSEYMATTELRKSKPATQVIYSNVKEVVEQGQYIFDTLWNAAIPAAKKIKEIEEGSVPSEAATIIENNPNEIIKQNRRIAESSNQISTCFTAGGIQYTHKYLYDTVKKLLNKQRRGEHKGIRYITNIDRVNIELVREYLKSGIQIRHARNLPPMSFGFSDKEIAATIDKMENGKRIQNLLISNESAYLKHFGSVFEELWNNAVDAADRIKDIEEGIDFADIEIIANPREGINRAWRVIKFARKEILIMFSSANALRRQIKMGGLGLLKDASEGRNVKVRLLIPHETDQHILSTILQESRSYCPRAYFRSMERSFCTKITIVIVDRKECIITELKDDTRDISYNAAGLSTNSRSIVSSYVSTFESIWKQTDLHEQLKVHDRMQEEFINVAAHELRTPIHPILGLSEILLSREGNIEEYHDIINAISRNAKRLERLTEDVLDITRIESGPLPLHKQQLNLKDLVFNIIADYRTEEHNRLKKIKLFYHCDKAVENGIIVNGDEKRLTQVICNLLSNAIKFTDEGGKIYVKMKRFNTAKQMVVSVTNTGERINPEIYPRLFTKFATSSFVGTGLGLYISKSIIETHGGRIWAKNNYHGKGATFSFSLPLVTTC